MLCVSRYHGITIVSTHSRPTPRLPVFILQTFYVFDVIFCIIIRTNKHLLDYVTSTQITLFTCIHYAYLSYTLDNNTMYRQFYVIQCYVGLHVITLTSSAVNYLTFPDTLLSQCNLIVIMFSLYMLHVLLFILTCTLFCSLHFTSLHSTELYTMYCYYNLCRVYTSYYIPRYLSVKPFFSINIMHTVVEMNTVMKLNDR